jgi:iron complex outermembrane recepter protein
MTRLAYLKSAMIAGASLAVLATGAQAAEFNIPSGDLKTALDVYTTQTGVELVVAGEAVRGVRTKGAKGELTATAALSRILAGTGFMMQRDESGAVGIVRANVRASEREVDVAQAAPKAAAAGIESVVVTSSKIKGDIQTVPIAITALSQEQLTSRQIAGGPDLVKEVPNLTFSKTNFTGYNIQIRGIGTQAISVTTDPAVAVALNDTPFIRNHFFEQEFYDVNQVEVLRGPQGTLYGRNATAGVVNVISAKPTDQFEAMASADIGNYHNRRFEGMVNVPIVDDRLDLRVAAEWTKRDGYSFNQVTGRPIDGRDLWSSRVTLGIKPVENLQAYLVWEHFSENDDRMRTAKQLCHRAPIAAVLGGDGAATAPFGASTAIFNPANYGSQGCQMSSLYSPDAFQVPNGFSLPYYFGASAIGAPVALADPYVGRTQSRNLRVIESAFNPTYRAKNDIVELNADYSLAPALTFTSQTAFNHDFLWSNEDYNRFSTAPGAFAASGVDGRSIPNGETTCNQYGCFPAGTVCDPQLGCSDRLTAEDLSDEHAWQLSQEFRLASNFSGPLNFSAGGNYLHYETDEDYYVFINSLTAAEAIEGTAGCGYQGYTCTPWVSGVSDNSNCLKKGFAYPVPTAQHNPYACAYIDPNPITSLNGNGHNYFRSQNPYVLNSYAGFGEVYYNISPDLKLTTGLRWTDDRKHFIDIPSELLVDGWGYPSTGVVNQVWNQLTGRAAANWTPKLDFTDQTLVYGSYSHGYKAGGANPPGAVLLTYNPSRLQTEVSTPIHPLTFRPEFVDAYELGTKNTLLDGGLTLNGDVFFYNYKAYQISEIVDRTSINLNFDAHVKGAEVEATWEPAPGLRFNFAGGYEDARLAKGSKAVDLIDRTAGTPGWIVVKPFVTQASNCILPDYVVVLGVGCGKYVSFSPDQHIDPYTNLPYVPNPTVRYRPDLDQYDPITIDYRGFDLGSAPNYGAGFDKDLSGNELPNAPHFTTSLSAEYTMPVSQDWAATLHSDFYWQSQSYARVFNDRPYDKIRGYSNVNLALILTSAGGWQVMGYLKNVFNVTAITGDFLNSDDSGLTTNVFLTDPRLYGVRVTKNF